MSRHWRARAQRIGRRHVALEPAADDFNLLPYRHLYALRARRRRRAELAGAALLGLACAAAVTAWSERHEKHQLQRRAALQREFTGLAPRLAESARLAALQGARREHDARLAAAAAQRERLVALLSASSRGAALGIGLADLRHGAQAATLQGEALSHKALGQWLRQLERLPGVDAVSVVRLGGTGHAAAGLEVRSGPAGSVDAPDSRVRFELHIAYRASPAAVGRARGSVAAAGPAR